MIDLFRSCGGFSVSKCVPEYYVLTRPFVAPAYGICCSGMKLDSKDLNGKSGNYSQYNSTFLNLNIFIDPFFEITVQRAGIERPVKLYRSSVQTGTLTPTWERFMLATDDVGGIDGKFTVNVYDWNKDGAHQLIGISHFINQENTKYLGVGSVTTSLWEFSLGSVQLPLINPAKVGRYALRFI